MFDRFFRGIASGVKKAGKAVIGVFADKSIGIEIGQEGTKVEVISQPEPYVRNQTQQFNAPEQVSDFSGLMPYLAIGILAYLVLK